MNPTSLFQKGDIQPLTNVIAVRNINDLNQVEISEKWSSLTDCVLDFKHLPICIWGIKKLEIIINGTTKSLSSQNTIDLKDLEQGKNIFVQLKFDGLSKKEEINPPIVGEIQFSHSPVPTFRINSEKCIFKLFKTPNGPEIDFSLEDDGDLFIKTLEVTKEQYGKVKQDETWELQVSWGGDILCRIPYSIPPPSLSFYELRVTSNNLEIELTQDDGFHVNFECTGWPPTKGDFEGKYVSEEKEYPVTVKQGKGKIFFRTEDFNYLPLNSYLPFYGQLCFEDFEQKIGNINVDYGAHLEFTYERSINHFEEGVLFSYKSQSWTGVANISIDFERTFGDDGDLLKSAREWEPNEISATIDIRGNAIKKSCSYSIAELRKVMPELNKIFQTQELAYINIELLAHSDKSFGQKVFTTTIKRTGPLIHNSTVKSVYRQNEVERWEFHPVKEYYTEFSEFKLVYSGTKMKMLEPSLLRNLN